MLKRRVNNSFLGNERTVKFSVQHSVQWGGTRTLLGAPGIATRWSLRRLEKHCNRWFPRFQPGDTLREVSQLKTDEGSTGLVRLVEASQGT